LGSSMYVSTSFGFPENFLSPLPQICTFSFVDSATEKQWCPYAWCLTTWRVAESFMCPIPGEFAMNSTQPSSPFHWCCAWSLLSLHDYMRVGNEDWSPFSLIYWILRNYTTWYIHTTYSVYSSVNINIISLFIVRE
jgi:hypothetical protein